MKLHPLGRRFDPMDPCKKVQLMQFFIGERLYAKSSNVTISSSLAKAGGSPYLKLPEVTTTS
jgi:hypothetical protein